MAINQNHLFEDLEGIKCAIVEKNASAARADFLRRLLEYNRYTVVVVPSPAPKVAPAAAPVAAATPAADAAVPPGTPAIPAVPVAPAPAPAAAVAPAAPPAPETFTVGVTDTMFNPTNAIFGRLLKTTDGHIVTLAYWQQKDKESHDEVPYFDNKF